MTTFVVGKPVATTVSSIVVDAGLPAGQHSFRLEVLTDTGQKSPPDVAVVEVKALVAPDPVLTMVSVSPTVASTPAPFVSPATIRIAVPVAPTLPKTASPSTTPRKVTPRKTRETGKTRKKKG